MSDTSITINYHYISPTILYGSDFEMPRPFHKSNPVRVYTLLILIVIACQHKKTTRLHLFSMGTCKQNSINMHGNYRIRPNYSVA